MTRFSSAMTRRWKGLHLGLAQDWKSRLQGARPRLGSLVVRACASVAIPARERLLPYQCLARCSMTMVGHGAVSFKSGACVSSAHPKQS